MKKPAPPIAAINAAQAYQNIKQKCALMEGVLKSPPGDVSRFGISISELPRSVRQFNLWAPVETSPVGRRKIQHRKNSSETLNKAPGQLLELVKALIVGVRDVGATEQPKQERIGALKKKLALSERLRGIAEREIQKYLDLHLDLSSQVMQLKDSNKSIAAKAKQEMRRLEEELQNVRSENSSLTKTLGKVTRLR